MAITTIPGLQDTQLPAGVSMLRTENNPDEKVGAAVGGPQSLEADIIWKVPWAIRWTFVGQLLGAVVAGNPTSTGEINTSFTLPHIYPYNRQMYCQAITRMTPYNPDATPSINGIAQYAEALITAHYSSPPGGDPSTCLWSETMTGSAEFMTLPPGDNLWWHAPATSGDPGEKMDTTDGLGLQIRMIEWTYTRKKAPLNILSKLNFLGAAGYINSSSMTSKTFQQQFNTNTVLYTGPTLSVDRFSDGSAALQVNMHFLIRKLVYNGAVVTWNQFPHICQKVGGTNYGTLEFLTPAVYNADGDGVIPVVSYPAGELNLLLSW